MGLMKCLGRDGGRRLQARPGPSRPHLTRGFFGPPVAPCAREAEGCRRLQAGPFPSRGGISTPYLVHPLPPPARGRRRGSGVSRPDLRAGRDYSLLSPAMPRKSSVVTFDISEPSVRRHSSPALPATLPAHRVQHTEQSNTRHFRHSLAHRTVQHTAQSNTRYFRHTTTSGTARHPAQSNTRLFRGSSAHHAVQHAALPAQFITRHSSPAPPAALPVQFGTPRSPTHGTSGTQQLPAQFVARHSSPAPSLRRKDSVVVADTGGGATTGTCSSSSSPSTTAAATPGGLKASDSRDPLAGNASARDHQAAEKRSASSSRNRRGDQSSSVLSVVDEVSSGGSPRSKLPKSPSDIRPAAATPTRVDRPRSSVDAGGARTAPTRAAMARHSTGGNSIDAPAVPPLAGHVRASLFADPPDSAPSCSPTRSAPPPPARDGPSASHGRQAAATSASATAARQVAEAETQTPPSVRDLRRSLIDYSHQPTHHPLQPVSQYVCAPTQL